MCLKNTHIHAILLLLSSIFIIVSSACTDSFIPGYNCSSNNKAEKQELFQLFEKWMKEHGKTYARLEEKSHRFENFANNFEYVCEWNANKEEGSHVLGLNKFADLSIEEFNSKYLRNNYRNKRKDQPRDKMNLKMKHRSCNVPPQLDWRDHGVVTRVKTQGYTCGGCWSFVATGAIESANAIKNGELVSLSEQELIDCSPDEGCVEGGDMEVAFDWVVRNGGISSESNYPYAQKDGKCNTTKAKNKTVKLNGYKQVAPNYEALLCAVTKQPIGVSITTNSPNFVFYTKGIYDGNCSNNPNDIDHQVLLVGYGSVNGTDYWILKNSWGEDWGEKGYIYMKRSKSLPLGKCTMYAEAAYPTIITQISPFKKHSFATQISGFWAICFVVCVLISNLLFV